MAISGVLNLKSVGWPPCYEVAQSRIWGESFKAAKSIPTPSVITPSPALLPMKSRLLCFCLAAGLALSAQAATLRIWTDSQGRKVQAYLVSKEESAVVL